jgi:hypothetical protein
MREEMKRLGRFAGEEDRVAVGKKVAGKWAGEVRWFIVGEG